MPQFSPELCKLESSNVAVYICRMSDCIVGLRFRVMALIFLFFIHFSFFPYRIVNIKIFVGVFSGIFKAKMLKLGIHMGFKVMTFNPSPIQCCFNGVCPLGIDRVREQ